jgi:hypothetical protein
VAGVQTMASVITLVVIFSNISIRTRIFVFQEKKKLASNIFAKLQFDFKLKHWHNIVLDCSKILTNWWLLPLIFSAVPSFLVPCKSDWVVSVIGAAFCERRLVVLIFVLKDVVLLMHTRLVHIILWATRGFFICQFYLCDTLSPRGLKQEQRYALCNR